MFGFFFFVLSSNTVTVPLISDPNVHDLTNYGPTSPVFQTNYEKKISSNCECGQRKTTAPQERVVGGEDTLPYEFPWIIFLLTVNPDNGRTSNCGATLINDRLLLTAGHCVTVAPDPEGTSTLRRLRPVERMAAHFHIYDRREIYAPRPGRNNTYIVIRIRKIIVHPGYLNVSGKPDDSVNDLALLVLEDRIDLTDPIFNPVCLPEKTDKIDLSEGRLAILAGWGRTTRGKPGGPPQPATKAQKLMVPIQGSERCLQFLPGKDLTKFICADAGDESGANIGDSGGPLFVDLESKQSLEIGVVSHGEDDKSGGTSGSGLGRLSYYSNVLTALPWIEYYSAAYDVRWCRRKSNPR